VWRAAQAACCVPECAHLAELALDGRGAEEEHRHEGEEEGEGDQHAHSPQGDLAAADARCLVLHGHHSQPGGDLEECCEAQQTQGRRELVRDGGEAAPNVARVGVVGGGGCVHVADEGLHRQLAILRRAEQRGSSAASSFRGKGGIAQRKSFSASLSSEAVVEGCKVCPARAVHSDPARAMRDVGWKTHSLHLLARVGHGVRGCLGERGQPEVKLQRDGVPQHAAVQARQTSVARSGNLVNRQCLCCREVVFQTADNPIIVRAGSDEQAERREAQECHHPTAAFLDQLIRGAGDVDAPKRQHCARHLKPQVRR